MKLNEKAIIELVETYNKKADYPTDADSFIVDAKRYIKAIKEGRMICTIGSVSSSGMSRTLRFVEMVKDTELKTHHINTFYSLFTTLGYTAQKDSDYFRIHGCGMDMVFHTNYEIIHQLHRLGFINKAQCRTLEQKTPHNI